MSIRIEGDDQALHLNVPKGSTVFVFPRPEKSPRQTLMEPELQIQEIVEEEVTRRAVQDYIDLGPEDIDQGIGLSRWEEKLRYARHLYPFDKFKSSLHLQIAEMSHELEGSRIGSVSGKLKAAEAYLISKAEELYTEPQ